jgi:hypothetical protein
MTADSAAPKTPTFGSTANATIRLVADGVNEHIPKDKKKETQESVAAFASITQDIEHLTAYYMLNSLGHGDGDLLAAKTFLAAEMPGKIADFMAKLTSKQPEDYSTLAAQISRDAIKSITDKFPQPGRGPGG